MLLLARETFISVPFSDLSLEYLRAKTGRNILPAPGFFSLLS